MSQITNIEFYNTPEGDVMMKEFGQPAVVLKDSDRPTIEYMLSVIRDRYPKAHARLMQLYSANMTNITLTSTKMVCLYSRRSNARYGVNANMKA